MTSQKQLTATGPDACRSLYSQAVGRPFGIRAYRKRSSERTKASSAPILRMAR